MRRAALALASMLVAATALAPAAAAPPRPQAASADARRPTQGAEPRRLQAIPEPLRPWIDWALEGHDAERCPWLQGDAPRCAWPSRLELAVDASSGRFTQEWLVRAPGAVELPVDAAHWPQDVRIDGAPAAVVSRGGAPVAWVGVGRHVLTGTFAWDSLPEWIQVPAATGLLSLSLAGKPVAFPTRDGDGRTWLQRRSTEEAGAQSLEVTVHRHVTDDVPLLLVTRLLLDVSGKGREVVLGPVLPEGFLPLALESPLPARLEPDGKLRAQVRAGSWVISVTARHVGPVAKLSPPHAEAPWAEEELWVFEARPALRVVDVEGVPPLDPQQTALPPEWKSLPAYRLLTADVMTLVERRRGDAEPEPDRLTLQRTLWLDFDGGGFTIHDDIVGTLSRSWRLEMQSPTELGHVAVAGEDELLTRLSPSGAAGVELRRGSVWLSADSRLPGSLRNVPAVGWDHEFHDVSGVLQLPPGWRLLAASGVDELPGTWLEAWSLLDLFLLLVVVMAFARLWGWPAGVLAFAALALTFPEAGAPRWTWLPVVVTAALARLLPEGGWRRAARATQLVALAALVLIAVPFLVVHVRGVIYPALEGQSRFATPYGTAAMSMPQEAAPMAPPAQDFRMGGVAGGVVGGVVGEAPGDATDESMSSVQQEAEGHGDKSGSQYWLGSKAASSMTVETKRQRRELHDVRDVIQTGPGLPRWSWRSFPMRWSGPVQPSQRVRLVLLPPAGGLALGIARALLLCAAALVALPSSAATPWWWIPRRRRAAPAVMALALAACGLMSPSRARAAEFPPNEMLDALRARVLAPAPCQPECAAISRMLLEVSGDTLRLRLEATADAETAIPLPGGASGWSPQRALLDGQPAPATLRTPDGRLWLLLPEGVHQVLLEGAMPAQDTVQLALPLVPHRVEARADGWRVDGIHEDGVADATLQLSRLQREKSPGGGALAEGALPPFVRVERTLELGLTWEATTSVVRASPNVGSVVLEIPLIEGESVTSEGLRVADGKALVNMGPGVDGVSWTSVLAEHSPIVLHAPETSSWTETWRLDASPRWHATWSGLPPVHPPAAARTDVRIPEWRPWPGETLTIEAVRPEAVPGPSLTVDASRLTVTPGVRATDVRLTIDVRSSRGGQHQVTLPAGARVEALSLKGVPQPIRQDDRVLTLTISPGAQVADVTWRQDDGIRGRYRSPSVDLGAPSVNAKVHVSVPRNRWILWTSGPRLGPAVLFWSLLAVIALLAVGLGHWATTPLGVLHWLLLFLGLTQVPAWAAGIVVLWLLLLGWRRDHLGRERALMFDAVQVALVVLTVASLVVLFASIRQGLLGDPDMQVAGNGSYGRELSWYADRAAGELPRTTVLSVPLLAYRLVMLAWALWIAAALLHWLRWAWQCFTSAGAWRRVRGVKQEGASGTGLPVA